MAAKSGKRTIRVAHCTRSTPITYTQTQTVPAYITQFNVFRICGLVCMFLIYTSSINYDFRGKIRISFPHRVCTRRSIMLFSNNRYVERLMSLLNYIFKLARIFKYSRKVFAIESFQKNYLFL